MTVADAFAMFGWAIAATLLAGLVAPLLGAHLFLRRTGIYGLVLPQFASAGVALGYVLLPVIARTVGLGGRTVEEALAEPHGVLELLLGFAFAATATGLAFQAVFARARATEGARAVAAFAVASAATLLLGQMSPLGAQYVESLLRGEVLAAGVHEFEVLALAFALAAALLLRFHADLVLVGFDPDLASVLRRPRRALEIALLAATGIVVAAGTLIVGPMVAFALLVLPPLAARSLARSIAGLFRLSAVLGIASSAAGLVLAFGLDQPLGPCVALAAAAVAALSWIAGRLRWRSW